MIGGQHSGIARVLVMSALAGGAGLLPSQASCQPKLNVIHAFTGGISGNLDGAGPIGALGYAHGAIFGTTYTGGGKHYGTAYAITPSGQEEFVKPLSRSLGYAPFWGVQQEGALFYATALLGGSKYSTCKRGCGSIFTVTERGKVKAVYHFGPSGSGTLPVDIAGTFYGVTSNGGAYAGGTFYSLSPTGVYTLLHCFGGGTDGLGPYGLINVNGTLYGFTIEGGTHNAGTAYAMTTTGSETILYSFGSVSGDALNPTTAPVYANGVLYGTSAGGGTTQCEGATGCGTIFSLSLSGAETVLHSFKTAYDVGYTPSPVLPVGKLLYGVAPTGQHGCGLIYSMTLQGKFSDLFDFAGDKSEGCEPSSPLLDVNGTLYGTTFQGGGTDGQGTLFGLTP